MKSKTLITVLIPIFNNSTSISLLLEELTQKLDFELNDFEFILVDDGSSDNFIENIVEHKTINIKIIQLKRNYGQVPAIYTGFRFISGKACVIISADMQEPIETINLLIKKWNIDKGLVIAKREKREDIGWKIFSSIMFNGILFFIFPKYPFKGFDFGIIDIEIVATIKNVNPYSSFLQIELINKSKSISYINYIRHKSKKLKSSWTFLQKLSYANNALYTINKHIYFKLIIFLTIIAIYAILTFKIILLSILFLLFLFVLMMWNNIKIKQKKEYPKVEKLIKLNDI